MADVFPLDDYLADELYPEYADASAAAPWFEEAARPFDKDDEAKFWVLEGHWGRGMTPLTVSAAGDVLFGTQYGADLFQLPPTKGNSVRFAGVHAYVSDLAVTDPFELGQRAAEVESRVGPVIMNFPELWGQRLERIKGWLARLEAAPVAEMDRQALAAYWAEALTFHRWVWQVHFELMDPLIGNYFTFRGTCLELGLDEADVGTFLQGRDTAIMATDRALWDLAEAARGGAAGAILTETPADAVAAALAGQPATAAWRERLAGFLTEYGWRTEGMCEPAAAPWMEDPSPVFAKLASFLRQDRAHDFAARAAGAAAQRETALAGARSRLQGEALAKFEGLLGANLHANFTWWQEEHDFYIDLRAHIPLRRAALRLAALDVADTPEAGIWLFRDELSAVLAGRRTMASLADAIARRRDYFEASSARRAEMPKVLGTVPESTDDPILKEIAGVDARMIEALRKSTHDSAELAGVPASRGVVQGRARVLRTADRLGEVEPGEILVCEFTSPNWTPVFALLAGCVSDLGGGLSHTAIVSREYQIPCVTGVGVATAAIRTGDLLEVDGDRGVVRILARS
jgi:pyruvate,water dikinase